MSNNHNQECSVGLRLPTPGLKKLGFQTPDSSRKKTWTPTLTLGLIVYFRMT